MTLDSLGYVLIVDDDPDVLEIVERCLVDAGYKVATAENGPDAMERIHQDNFDLAIVDIGLPGTDGLTLTRSFKEHTNIGIIILSGRGDTTDRIVGLEVGADDYVTKPFEPRELLARVRSVLRRVTASAPVETQSTGETYSFDNWQLDAAGRKLISADGEAVSLTSGEFDMLLAFVTHANRVLSRDQLLDLLTSSYRPAFDRSIDVRLGRLRRKIEVDPKSPELIKTIRNVGYIFSATVKKS
ncbi:MAG: response regulator [Alphaproteobacteria bacterium]|jgi:two-component system, OmpR family, response regulator|nr:response regulator [Alphaproteobacteria bacterium]MBT4083659.1 response regulator [Alphaproteobacteria bacterium]MBT4545181.1 response regulator [Alphaproteobacteria bacterium]MBT7746562.1 response regulator [Alphaproteobacteria bacterium]